MIREGDSGWGEDYDEAWMGNYATTLCGPKRNLGGVKLMAAGDAGSTQKCFEYHC